MASRNFGRRIPRPLWLQSTKELQEQRKALEVHIRQAAINALNKSTIRSDWSSEEFTVTQNPGSPLSGLIKDLKTRAFSEPDSKVASAYVQMESSIASLKAIDGILEQREAKKPKTATSFPQAEAGPR